ncbi:MAG: ATP-dependent RNA helicase HrpA [Candidatus Aminicenantales bacterium]
MNTRSSTARADAAASLKRIHQLLGRAMLRQADLVSRKLEEISRQQAGRLHADPRRLLETLAGLEKRLEESARERQARAARRPRVRFLPELPITAKAPEIIRAVKDHPVVIVSGETGCGKSTQLPKMCLEAGGGLAGQIACTQPRRIAAVTIAHRIAEEMGERLGRSVGYKIRFQDETPRQAYIKIMTDGMLLAEAQSDRRLAAYDTLIIDEAHERSLNIDFLLGIARTLLRVRPELRVVITSATLDTEKFVRAFDGAPVIEVKGRLYPVEVEYRLLDRQADERAGGEEAGYVEQAVEAVDYLKKDKPAGDTLVFMPTEQDILETCQLLEGRRYSGTTVLPLYARLPGSQQGRVYSASGPKIVVATNVAETSLTIPGIRYVVDTGLARIAQYQPGTRISSLPISPVSRSSADQRKGRCGRVGEGLCLRLYSEEDYDRRPRFTPPEIFRSNLAEVILRMIFLRLGDPVQFPFVDAPSSRLVKDGYETLFELGALRINGPDYELTDQGRMMARMPLDPRIARMLLEAHQEGCLPQVAVIASALSIRDPRERPPEKASEADRMQAVFKHPDSDFLTILNIWNRFHGTWEKLSTQSQKRRFCREHFLSFPRMQEWTYIHGEILEILDELRIPAPPRKESRPSAGAAEVSPTLYAGIHRSILSGLLSNIAAHKEKNFYSAAKGREAMIFPGSTLFNKSASWIMASEMVKTSRLYARTAARIDSSWIEPLAAALCRRAYSDPYWDKDRGEVLAKERVTLFGLEIVADRRVPFGPVNPEEAHQIFVRSGLLEGNVKNPPEFLRRNLALVKRLAEMEDRLRRRNILAGPEAMAAFYTKRLAGIYDLRGLRARIDQEGGDDFLLMAEDDLLVERPAESELAQFPDRLPLSGRSFKTSYKFEPGAEDDGVTLKVPHALLTEVPAERLEWGVPGQFKDKVLALIKGLPRRYRKLLVPTSETSEVIVKEMPRQPERSLFAALAEFVKRRFRMDIPAAEWEKAAIPEHLRMRVAVLDHTGKPVLAGRDLQALVKKSGAPSPAPKDSSAWKEAQKKWERTGIIAWDFGSLPESVAVGPLLAAYPVLEPAERGANIRLFDNREEAVASHRKGVQSLLLVKFAKDLEFMKRYLRLSEELVPAALFFGGQAAVEKALHLSLAREALQQDMRTEEEFKAWSAGVVRRLFEKGHELMKAVGLTLETFGSVRAALSAMKKEKASSLSKATPSKTIQAFSEEIEAELGRLVPKDFLERYGLERLIHLPRYLKALELRLERAKQGLEKDRHKAAQAEVFIKALEKLGALKENAPAKISPAKHAAIEEFRWLVEEFKVSLFAPELRTAVPVSAKRLEGKLKEIADLD